MRQRPSLARLAALAELSADLGSASTEREVESVLSRATHAVFGATARLSIFVGAGADLVSSTDGHSVRTMLGGEAPLRVFRAPHLMAGNSRRGARVLAPMIVRGALFGVLALERAPGGSDFTLGELELLLGIAGAAGLALHQARRRISTRQLELAEDLAEAREVQRGLLPSLAPVIGPLRIATAYRPAHDVGGDFYDVVLDASGRAVVVIGDVSGCGLAAALLMARITTELHRIAREGNGPSRILEELDVFTAANVPDHGFVTVACLAIEPSERSVVIANAGHVPAIVRRASGEVELRGVVSGLPLGVASRAQWAEEPFAIGDGDLVLLTTDGVVEGLGPEHGPEGLDRLVEIVRDAPTDVAAANRTVLEALDQLPRARLDDVTLLAFSLASSE